MAMTEPSLKVTLLVVVTMMIVLPSCYALSDRLNIASFNVQVFGRAKISKPEVVNILVKIIRRYDIILLQEIRDSSETAIVKLLNEVNSAGVQQYGMTVSARLGRTNSKEQYAFLYKLALGISVKDTYQYPDPNDVFEREPYSVLFNVKTAEVKEFVLVAIHASPDKAVEEINALSAVYSDLIDHWKNDDVLILGDFNADCGYVTKTKMKTLVLLKDATFHWWIPNEADTTVSGTDCAYDRFVMAGTNFIDSVIDNSATVFYFDKEYGLTLSEAKLVSDHYPIEIAVKANLQATSQASPVKAGGILQNMVLKKLTIASFNVQVFGRTKVSKPEVVKVLVEIIRRYEIILIQEIRDISGTAILKLLDQVNRAGTPQYGIRISERLGKTTSKEQYAFLYQLGVGIEVRGTHVYPDQSDIFEREPYSVYFTVKNSKVPSFILSAIHASPKYAVEEINHLPLVHDDLFKKWNNNNILILGDFNADCSYVTKEEMNLLTLKNKDKFHWWIPSEADTTVSGTTNCAYDRFVMTGSDFINAVAGESARVFHFDQAYGLSNEFARKVSDHYPIELSIELTTTKSQRGGGVLNYIDFYKSICLTSPSSEDNPIMDKICRNLKSLKDIQENDLINKQ